MHIWKHQKKLQDRKMQPAICSCFLSSFPTANTLHSQQVN